MRAVNRDRADAPTPVVVPEGVFIDPSIDEVAIGNAEARLLAQFPELQGKVIVLFLGRLNFKKGIDILVEAFAAVNVVVPEAHLLFVGPDSDGYSSQIRLWLAEFGVAANTSFTGMLRGADKLAAFRLARVFVLPSYTENFGIAIVEAMTQHCPVVISNKVNIWREIADAGAGIVVDCDVAQTSAAILRIVQEPDLAASLAANGERLAREYFSWPAAAAKMEAAYQRLANPDSSTARFDSHG
jgi:glycosyltransferase involved in cell wall biosynthesis